MYDLSLRYVPQELNVAFQLLGSAARARSETGLALVQHAAKKWEIDPMAITKKCPVCSSPAHGPYIHPDVTVSVSHSADHVVVAMGPSDISIGVDIEDVANADVANRVVAGNPKVPSIVQWVALEAIAKSTHEGLFMDLEEIDIDWTGRSATGRGHGFVRHLAPLRALPEHCVGMIALDHSDFQLVETRVNFEVLEEDGVLLN